MTKQKQFEFRCYVSEGVAEYFLEFGRVPEEFPFHESWHASIDGAFCDLDRAHLVDEAVRGEVWDMSPHELRLWADRIRYDNL